MVKKTLIAVALVAFLATVVQAASPSIKEDDAWPGHWVWDSQDICQMPVYMDVGMYVQLKDCHKKKIELKQRESCPSGQKYPCYTDCETFDLRANFNVKLGSRLINTTGIVKGKKSYYDGGDTYDFLSAGGNYKPFKVCVDMWETEIWESAPGDKVKVADLVITVVYNP